MADGQLITESYCDYTRKLVRKEYESLDNFLTKWNPAKRRRHHPNSKSTVSAAQRPDEVGNDYDDFDLICHIAYDQPPLTRNERADNVKKRDYFAKYGDQARAVFEALLDKYAEEGVLTIEKPMVLNSPDSSGWTRPEIVKTLRWQDQLRQALQELENEIFDQTPQRDNVSGTIKSIQDIMRKDVGVDGDARRITQLVWMFFLKIYDDPEDEIELPERLPLADPRNLRWRNWAADPEGMTGDALRDFVNIQLFPTLRKARP